MLKTQKARILTAIILVISVLAVSVSAEFLGVDKYGLYDWNSNVVNVGTALSGYYSTRWALSGLSPDYTYDCWFQLNFVENIPNNYSISQSFYLTSDRMGYFDSELTQNWTKLGVQLGSIEKLSEKSIKVHLYWNHTIADHYEATLNLAQRFFINSGGIKWVGQGVGVYYDPGGSNYEEILQMINSNVENLPDRIKEVLEKHDQDVKNESSTEGNDKIDQAINALKNAIPVSSVKDAITPLMTACNYEGTNSVWTFPSITIPAIPGLFDEMKLSDEQSFDLSTYADEYIPETLLQLVRYLMTAGLILFAIKELMSIISQIFGGSGSGGDGG